MIEGWPDRTISRYLIVVAVHAIERSIADIKLYTKTRRCDKIRAFEM